ncbi:hypothetical protein Vau01_039600 [Virgisporangium aurantiacum]|uniref:TIR domain-containing protein n=1 Tax=Virgisporangium aurantiacum TaxID=175570 RepID=A0A8J3Z355_9ACTN|nr:hypothetical protein Vau01_039600 [Virgisporangium aurantiacum]
MELERVGYSTFVQSFDFRPGTDFVHRMQHATATSGRTIAVLSPAYLGSAFGEAEWRTAFARDPSGEHGLLLPVRIEPCEPPGMLATRVYVDLVGVTEAVAREKLLAAVDRNPSRPTTAAYPGGHRATADGDTEPARFPGRPSPDRGRAVPHELPSDVPDFVGRGAEIRTLLAALGPGRRGTGGVSVVAVYGPPGVGKTALAVHAGHRLVEAFPDGQLYADLRGNLTEPGDPGEALAAFLRAFGLRDGDIAESLDERAARYRSLLHGRRVLVVLDNAADERQIRPLLPGAPTAAVLITARAAPVGIDGALPVALDPLPPAAAARLLRHIAGPRARGLSDQARQIVEHCGRLPLAVRIAGARLLVDPHLDARSYSELLADESRRLDELSIGDRAVRASVNVSYAALEPVQQYVFRLLGSIGPVTFAPWLATALAGLDAPRAEAALRGLVRAQLVQAARDGRYRLHDLVRLFAAERAAEAGDDERRAAVRRAADACCGLVERINARVLPAGDGGVTADARTPEDALAQFRTERETLLTLAERLAAPDTADAAWRLVVLLPALLQMVGDWTGWQRVTRAVLTAAAGSGDDYAYARVLLGWAAVRREKGALDEAADSYRRAHDLLEAAGDTDWQAQALAGLGAVRREQGRMADAAATLDAAIALFRRCGNRRGEALALSNLGTTLLNQGQDSAAEEAFRDSRATFESLGDRRWVAYCLGDLADLYGRRGSWAEAGDHQERALAILRAYDDQLGIARSHGHLAEIRQAEGRYDRAVEHALAGLRIVTDLGAPLERARSLERLAGLCERTGDPEGAARYRHELTTSQRPAE